MRISPPTTLIALLAFTTASFAKPVTLDGPEGKAASVTLLEGYKLENGNKMNAIVIDLEPGWKTYWRYPGDTGVPPIFDWGMGEDTSHIQYHWPAPTLYDEAYGKIIGYEGRVVLPIEFKEDIKPPSLHLKLGICSTICLPFDIDFETQSSEKIDQNVIETALLQSIPKAETKGVSLKSCAVTSEADTELTLHAEISGTPIKGKNTVLIESKSPEIQFGLFEATPIQDGLSLTATGYNFKATPFSETQESFTLSLFAGGSVLDLGVCAPKG